MNANRRKRLEKISEELDMIVAEEQEAFDNLPMCIFSLYGQYS